MGTLGVERAGRYLEIAGVLLLLGAALVTRARDLAAPFDRGHDGARGASLFFGVLRAAEPRALRPGTPGPDPGLAGGSLGAKALGRAALRVLRPTGSRAAPPEGTELALRLPFLLASVLGSWALWAVLRRASDPGTAMIALAIHAASPLGVLYGGLPGGELPGIAAALIGAWVGLRPPPRSRGRLAAWAGLLLAAALCEPRAPLLALPGLGVALLREGRRAALPLVLGAAPAVVVALLAPDPGSSGRVSVARPGLVEAFGALPLVAAAIGLALGIAAVARRGASAARAERSPVALVPVLLLVGGAGATLGAWRGPAGDPALAFLGPGVAACAALCLRALARPMLRLRAGLAPHALAVGTLVLPGLASLAGPLAALRGPGAPRPAELGAGLAAAVPATAIVAVPPEVPLAATSFYAWRRLVRAGAPGPEATHVLESGPLEAPGTAALPGWWVRTMP